MTTVLVKKKERYELGSSSNKSNVCKLLGVSRGSDTAEHLDLGFMCFSIFHSKSVLSG